MENQTAVEWLIEKHFGGINNCTPDFRFHIKQALEMEKQQIEKAYSLSCTFDSCIETKNGCRCGKQYYNQTYKSK